MGVLRGRRPGWTRAGFHVTADEPPSHRLVRPDRYIRVRFGVSSGNASVPNPAAMPKSGTTAAVADLPPGRWESLARLATTGSGVSERGAQLYGG